MHFQTLGIVCGYVICGLTGLLGLLIIWRIADGSIDLSRLISEPNGDASMSRFQFLIFTFVIALSLFLVIVSSNPVKFPDVPGTVLSLLGISGSSYLVSKGIQFSDPAGVTDSAADVIISPVRAVVPINQTQQFKAEVPKKPGSAVKWEVVAGPGSIDADGVYTATVAADAVPAQGKQLHATIQATSVEYPDASDLAVVSLV